MKITIANAHIEAAFSTKGAELQSLKSIKSNVSYLWEGNPAVWGKFSPILFPIVGALKDDTYYYEGKQYALPRHGFARDLDFEINEQTDTRIVFSLAADEETLSKYPFRFKLSVIYELVDAAVTCAYRVSNLDDKEMLFSIGGHPAFAAPIDHEGSYQSNYLQFDADDVLVYHHIEANLISPETSTINLNNGKLQLEHSLFYQDALVFKNLKSRNISLRSTENEHGLTLSFSNFPYFGIWAAKDANFVCLEPWCGVADSVDHNQQLAEKEGMQKLSANAVWERMWKVTCF